MCYIDFDNMTVVGHWFALCVTFWEALGNQLTALGSKAINFRQDKHPKSVVATALLVSMYMQ